MKERVVLLAAEERRGEGLGAAKSLVLAIDVERGAAALGFVADLLDGTNPRLAKALGFRVTWPDGADEARRCGKKLMDAARILREASGCEAA